MRVIIFFLVLSCASPIFSQKKNSNAWIKEQAVKSKGSPIPSEVQNSETSMKRSPSTDPQINSEKYTEKNEESNQNQERE
ncbi:MAG: hypothetical protein ACOVP5_07740, partial [Chitinophagales bacterium]